MNRKIRHPVIGITIGEPTGIGPELIFKAFKQGAFDAIPFVVFSDAHTLTRTQNKLKISAGLHRIEMPFHSYYQTGCINYFPIGGSLVPTQFKFGRPDHYTSSLAYESIVTGARFCLQGELTALVTNPVSKESIVKTGKPRFKGHTGLLSEISGIGEDADMVFGCEKGIVGLVTTHIPLKTVSQKIGQHEIVRLIRRMSVLTVQLFHTSPNIAVMGLNPHAGEGGILGTEERQIIIPAIQRCRRLGLSVSGPFPSDSFWRNYYPQKQFNVITAMYHDQGLIPVKSGLLGQSVNISVGLPFIRTSPDHGTALDIAGKGIADPSSLVRAYNTAIKLMTAALIKG